MKALRVLFACVVLFAAFCCVNEARAQFKTSGFFLGTLGYYTFNETAFGGLTGYVGVSRNNRGLGVMGSYEVGNTTFEGYDVQIQFTNFYFSASLKLGSTTLMVSEGFTTTKGSLEEFEVSRSGYATAITLIYDRGSRIKFMGQVRIQGEGIMLTAGVGF
ncbi:hypothetical protein F4Z99_17600 [Candidatus Poribacteria bacterium]|nr:hypothetical protein [Candidatus Poribacteria bacterium]MYA98658.1 hypothetical protein [Candidatus Poribacteria bacterium]